MDIGFQLFSARSFPPAAVLDKAKHLIAGHDNLTDVDRFAGRPVVSIEALGA